MLTCLPSPLQPLFRVTNLSIKVRFADFWNQNVNAGERENIKLWPIYFICSHTNLCVCVCASVIAPSILNLGKFALCNCVLWIERIERARQSNALKIEIGKFRSMECVVCRANFEHNSLRFVLWTVWWRWTGRGAIPITCWCECKNHAMRTIPIEQIYTMEIKLF